MEEFVKSRKDVAQNIKLLHQYRNGPSKEFHDALVSKGKLFVVGLSKDGYAFAPSRFAGYKSNDQQIHKTHSDRRDGRLTNRILNALFGPPLDENCAETALYKLINDNFRAYCQKNKIIRAETPNCVKYWVMLDAGQIAIALAQQAGPIDRDDAVEDLNDIGIDRPGARTYVGRRYARHPKIRAAVKTRAAGVCEYCKKPGFVSTSGSPYLECHHIIALADDGADRMTNVIALCPEDHRKAHFGKHQGKLEKEMIAIISGNRRLR